MSTSEAAVGRAEVGGGIEIRVLPAAEVAVWAAAVNAGFLHAGEPAGEEYRLLRHYPDRTLGAFDDGRCVGTFRSMPFELTLPGGELLPVSAITGVTVSQTHRRRGLLSRMMARDLGAARGRGEAVAVLIAAEYGIYGRFGFGPATRQHGWRIDLRRSRGIRTDLPASFGPAGGRLDLVDMAELAKIGPELHERWRRGQPGAVSRDEAFWRAATGQVEVPAHPWKEPFAVVHRDAAGVVTGLAVYRVGDHWDGPYPDCTVKVGDFLALDRSAEVSLWRYLCSMDWCGKLEVSNLAPDSPLPLLLVDPRGAVPHEDNCDLMWLRVLDVPAAFAARRCAGAGRVVLEVSDPAGYAAGRWALTVDADGVARAAESGDEPDLALTAGALGSLYLGAESASRLAAAGLVEELRSGSAFALDRLLGTPVKAWNPDYF
ncbi:GNAT family N-acetyltransferase [Kitasatospora sp. NBC_01266]|uniref:GNAT family N-acetyltransferase n=1 Tax=Kitasatospora sp. NBC_01266 TaxID=2903572 RepID=UPI002E358FEB|nr:GNAT family N-acetyltransferase [Kitasatospora sp. NBC_01266]